jgi:outer membrane protein assembly factor BamB
MDVGPDGVAYASLSTAAQPTVSKLYTLNVTSGAATLVGGIGSNLSVVDVAVVLSATPVYAVTTDNKLVTFNASTPEIITSTKAITGLAEMEQVQAIDFRPSTGELIATTNGNHVYALNLNTGSGNETDVQLHHAAL